MAEQSHDPPRPIDAVILEGIREGASRDQLIRTVAEAEFQSALPDLEEAVAIRRHEYLESERTCMELRAEVDRTGVPVRRSVISLKERIHELQGLIDRREDTIGQLYKRFRGGFDRNVLELNRLVEEAPMPTSAADSDRVPNWWRSLADDAVKRTMGSALFSRGAETLVAVDGIKSLANSLAALNRGLSSYTVSSLPEVAEIRQRFAATWDAPKKATEAVERFAPNGKFCALVGELQLVEIVTPTSIRRGYTAEYRQEDLTRGLFLGNAAYMLTFERGIGSFQFLSRNLDEVSKALDVALRTHEQRSASAILEKRDRSIVVEREGVERELKAASAELAKQDLIAYRRSLDGRILSAVSPELFSEEGKSSDLRRIRSGSYNALKTYKLPEIEEAELALIERGALEEANPNRPSKRFRSELGNQLKGALAPAVQDQVFNLLSVVEIQKRGERIEKLGEELQIGQGPGDLIDRDGAIFTCSESEVDLYAEALRAFAAEYTASPIRAVVNMKTQPELLTLGALQDTIAAHRREVINHYAEEVGIASDIAGLLHGAADPEEIHAAIGLLTSDTGPLSDPIFGALLIDQDPRILQHPNLEAFLEDVRFLRAEIGASSSGARQRPECPDRDNPGDFTPERFADTRARFNQAVEAEKGELLQLYYELAGVVAPTKPLTYEEVEGRTESLTLALQRGGWELGRASSFVISRLRHEGGFPEIFFEEDSAALASWPGRNGREQFSAYVAALGDTLREIDRKQPSGDFSIELNPSAFSPQNLGATSGRLSAAVPASQADPVRDSLSSKLIERLEDMDSRLRAITSKLARSSGPSRAALEDERSQIDSTLALYRKYEEAVLSGKQIRQLTADAALGDPVDQEAEVEAIKERLIRRVLDHNPILQRDAIVEVRALDRFQKAEEFAASLMQSYGKFLKERGYSVEVISLKEGTGIGTGRGGISEGILLVKGSGAFGVMQSEIGTHSFRSHASATEVMRASGFASVAVLPDVEPQEEVFNLKDVQIETMRSSGAGGQNVNRRETAIRATHLPSGLQAAIQNERSQTQNRALALKVLAAKVQAQEVERLAQARSAARRDQIGVGVKGGAVRVYNAIHNEVTDSRAEITISFDDFVAGNLGSVIDQLMRQNAEREYSELRGQ